MKEIPVFFTFDRCYVVPAAVAFHTLLKYADKGYVYCLYVLHIDLVREDQRWLGSIVHRFENATLTFIDMANYPLGEEARKGKSHFSKDIFYKLVAAEIFPQYDRILCSDVDVIFRGDISKSFFMYENEFFYYAGVGQIIQSKRMDTYKKEFSSQEQQVLEQEIAAGYLLFNLKAIRENNMQEKLTDFYLSNYHRLKLPEQDTLILCCWPYVKQLPMEYLVCNTYYRLNTKSISFYTKNKTLTPSSDNKEDMLKQFEQSLSHPVQLHYVGPDKPWNSLCCPKQLLWFASLKEAGAVIRYIASLPAYMQQKIKRYSIKRFMRKLYGRLTSKPIYKANAI